MPLDYKIAERTLANGLRVIVSEDHSVPNVTVNLWVNVGSRHEVGGRTGFAHLFEHLMFQGSLNVASGEHFSALMAAGGRLNATTWFDRTNYFETVPRGAMDLALWMEADRHGRLLDAVNQENLDNQRDVVKEEKRQRDEHMEDVPSDHLYISFRLPVDDTPEFFASSLAMDAIGGLATSRLSRRLVRREQSATSVSAHAMGFVDGISLGFMMIDVAEGFGADAVEEAVCEELVRFAQQGPTDIEMESAMAQTERSWLSSLASQEERADHICHFATLQGDSGYINTFLDRFAQVTPAQVQQAAATWLGPQSRAVVAYLKQDGDTQ